MKKLKYCEKKIGNSSTCGNLAQYKVILGDSYCYRCEKHKNTKTRTKKVQKIENFNQTIELYEVNKYLKSLIGKTIFSNFHKKELLVKYVKTNASIMCIDNHGDYKLVFHNQITEIV